MKFLLPLFLLIGLSASQQFLRLSGGYFFYGNQRVYLSGTNIAWNSYGHDFGNDNYSQRGPQLEQWIQQISQAGGNSLRIWLHIEAENTPQFNGTGFVTAPDGNGRILQDMERFLDVAAQNNVFVVFVLWNGALMRQQRMRDLIMDDAKLESYISNALRPMVRRLATKPALGAWEVMNEPEGSVQITNDNNRCYNTQLIGQQGAGWTGANIPMQRFLRFIARQNSAIRQEDPKVLITAGSWAEHSQNDVWGNNHYTDACLNGAGGVNNGHIDFYQMHTYSWEGNWSSSSPFRVNASQYNLNKPIVIGEWATSCAMNEGVNALWDAAYNRGYQGNWVWQYNADGHCADTRAAQNQGMTRIKDYFNNGIIPINIG